MNLGGAVQAGARSFADQGGRVCDMPLVLRSGAVIHQGLEAVDVQDADVLLLDCDIAFFLELGKSAGDGFQFEPQVAANFFAGHAQVKL